MRIMPYGALPLAEDVKNNGDDFLQISPLSDEDWSIAVRGIRRYEECAWHYFGKYENRGLWLGDKYLMYGENSPHRLAGDYVGVRRRGNFYRAWIKSGLSDRGEEGRGLSNFGSFDLVWKAVLRSLATDFFWRCDSWRKVGRVKFFEGKIPDAVGLIEIGRDGFPVNELHGEALDYWGSILNRSNVSYKNIHEGKSMMGVGCILYSKDNDDFWYHTVNSGQSDISWSFGLEIEDWVDLLFEEGMK
ncbi:hypothetical protein [Corynebacterium lowii]|uniref:Uncharacterized protein n=1 Tax=Corynebacterium lowii TaxID=1544413 RepID=A0A0Q1AIX8_9CORY|nr:hypothetical protein [Corynebacterium lowii]KQB86694.1 hypothetical protein Clow_00902 [Corynebacterium lowii]MDP9851380.1 hypothetical protein [Corynebacterium lowii]